MRAASRDRLVAELPIATPPEHPGATSLLKVTVYFSAGGLNYYNYETEPKGFYLSASPMERLASTGTGMTTEYYGAMMSRGLKTFLEAAPRFNAKRLATLAATVKTDPRFTALVAKVLAKSHLELATVA